MKKKMKTKLLLHPGEMHFSGGRGSKLNQAYAADANVSEKIKGDIYVPLFYLFRMTAVFLAGCGFAMLIPESFQIDIDKRIVYIVMVFGVLVSGLLKYAVKNKWLSMAGFAAIYGFLGFKFYKEIVSGFSLTLCRAIESMMKQFDVHVPEWAEELSRSQWSVTAFAAALAVIFTGIVIIEAGMGGGSVCALLMFAAVAASVLITGTGLPAKPVIVFVFAYFVLAASGKMTAVADAGRAALMGLKGMMSCAVFLILAMAVSALVITEDMHLTKEKTEQIKVNVQAKLENIGAVIEGKRDAASLFNLSGGISEGRLDKAAGLDFNGQLMLKVHTGHVADGNIYLRGFVSDVFKNNRWYALSDKDFVDFIDDDEKVMTIWNMQSESLASMGQRDTMTVEKQNGVKGSFAPYGAVVDETLKIHGDGWLEGGNPATYTYFPVMYDHTKNFEDYEGVFSERFSDVYADYVREKYLQLPDGLDDHAETFARLKSDFTVAEGSSLSDKIAFIQNKIWSMASYTVTPDKLPADRAFVPYFLYESHEGYCMHFATAGVILLRLNHIPARYAEGFVCAPGNFHKEGANGYQCDVRDFQAHAWAEVYIDGFGWIPVEMTPGYVNADNISAAIHNQGNQALDTDDETGPDSAANAQTSDEMTENTSETMEETEPGGQNAGTPDAGEDADDHSGSKDDGGHGDGTQNADGDGDFENFVRKFKIPAWFWTCLKVMAALAAAAGLILGRCFVMAGRYAKLFGSRQKKKALFTMYRGINRWLWLAGAGHLETATGLERMAAVENLENVSEEMFSVFEMVVWKAAFGKDGVSDEEYMAAVTAYDTIVCQIEKKLSVVKNIFAKIVLCLPRVHKMQG